jgi:hypothetical protein
MEQNLMRTLPEGSMFKRFCAGTAIAAFLAFGAPTGSFAQDQPTTNTGAKEHAKRAGKKTKKAGEDAGSAAKEAGKATAKATKKTAKTVKQKVTPDMTTATCKDGTVQSGHTKVTACKDHGGVAAKQ